MSLNFADPTDQSVAAHVIDETELPIWLGRQDAPTQAWAMANAFNASHGQALVIPAADGQVHMALIGYGNASSRARTRFPVAAAAAKLPEGIYHIASGPQGQELENECLGWLLSQYRFDRYRTSTGLAGKGGAALVAPKGIDMVRVQALASGEALTRDLINTPASDMGPNALQDAAAQLAKQHGARMTTIHGEDLLQQNFPMIHAVGRASVEAPRLIDIRHGDAGPRLTLVGKGVCFDTGGLDLKPASSMGLMKKDMGGAATVLGLAHMILSLKLPIQLRVLIPAVENAVAGNAFRPQDILTSRKGLTVEINNTDAEGRLVLADALALADEEKPDLIVSMATLTGAARVAVGPDLAPFYATRDQTALALADAATQVADPVWRMPFHDPYEERIEPGIADLDNAPSGGFAGSITAALFLRRFVTQTPYLHFDIYGWQPVAAPARPKGGAGQGARALLAALPALLDL